MCCKQGSRGCPGQRGGVPVASVCTILLFGVSCWTVQRVRDGMPQVRRIQVRMNRGKATAEGEEVDQGQHKDENAAERWKSTEGRHDGCCCRV